jgi:hypothetical protein
MTTRRHDGDVGSPEPFDPRATRLIWTTLGVDGVFDDFTTRDFFLDDTAACFVAHVEYPVAGMKIVKLTMKPCQITASTAPSDRAYATLCNLDTCSGLLGGPTIILTLPHDNTFRKYDVTVSQTDLKPAHQTFRSPALLTLFHPLHVPANFLRVRYTNTPSTTTNPTLPAPYP